LFRYYRLLGVACLPLYGAGMALLVVLELWRLHERYIISDKSMVIEKGYISKAKQIIKIVDIRSVHIEQSWNARLLRVGSLWISIGNSAGHQIVLKGIRNPMDVYAHLGNN
jgi:uncharacterized membrane protein YdbT with pleckstrin-like domain